jgi:hypothetical protein
MLPRASDVEARRPGRGCTGGPAVCNLPDRRRAGCSRSAHARHGYDGPSAAVAARAVSPGIFHVSRIGCARHRLSHDLSPQSTVHG